MKPELHGAPNPACPPARAGGRRRFLVLVGGLLLVFLVSAYAVLPLTWRTDIRRHPDLAGSRSRSIGWTVFIGNWRGRMEVEIRGTRMAASPSRCCGCTRHRQPPRRTAWQAPQEFPTPRPSKPWNILDASFVIRQKPPHSTSASQRLNTRALSCSAFSSAARVFDFPPSAQSNSMCIETGAR
jgi:hypothetical protein